MFDVGFWEIIIIVLVALLVVGPERLPGLAREIGRWVGKTRRFVHSVRADFEQELQTEELRNMLKSQDREIRQLKSMMDETETSLREDIEDTQASLREDVEAGSRASKNLSEDEQKAVSEKRKEPKPAVRDKPSMHAKESPDADVRDESGAEPRFRRLPAEENLDANLMTDDPALAAEQQARAAEAPRADRDSEADAGRARGSQERATESGADTSHDDQTSGKHS